MMMNNANILTVKNTYARYINHNI